MKRLCSIYRCAKKEGMYVYVNKTHGLDSIPKTLLRQIGKTELVMTLLLTPNTQLALAKANEVLQAIEEKGFYLQMPPSLQEPLGDNPIVIKNTKL
ncbi:hypothetical protein AB835_07750 [Candidatus Endobugula sertula]|uniref:YcgL domain-containing protein AB835_07750 n=1 Tax=Candidatus Endobugula sertula TaxID=62101 RepID=A0A1D2QQ15_9GAMM|nr:hypothetical protein AB835_07750 [Candidatus Endobugula sertula]